MSSRDYYCNNKFKFLKVDLEKNTTYNCHAARPHAIDIAWLKKNPGEIFNTEVNMYEREQMLRNERNSSCEQNCWFAEDRGAVGPRILEKGYEKTHTVVRTQPEIIDLTIGRDCNLQCTYCCKEYSSSWARDISQHGPYLDVGDPNRFSLNQLDIILSTQSQKEKLLSDDYQTILNELEFMAPTAKKIIITGGEPLLHNSLIDILERMDSAAEIKLFTGLGVDFKRFEKLLSKLQTFKNLYVSISMENIGRLYEFNRYGMTWEDAQRKIDLLTDHNMRVTMHSTLSNLSLFGFPDFYHEFSSRCPIRVDMAYNPGFMPIYVIDPTSKQRLTERLKTLDFLSRDSVLSTLQIEPTETQRLHLANFVKQFLIRHPDLDFGIFPDEFRTWLEI